MVHKMIGDKFKKKSKSQKATKRKSEKIVFAFGIEKAFSSEIKQKFPKKIFAFTSREKVGYAVRASQKIPYTKEISLALIDAEEGGYSNVAIELEKQVIFIKGIDPENGVYQYKSIDKSNISEAIQDFAENYFIGFGFKVLELPVLKEIEKAYMPNNALKYRALAIIAIVGLSIFVYHEYQKQHQHIGVKPPMPSLPNVSTVEQSDLKRKISLKVFNKILHSITAISKGEIPDSVGTTRIALISFMPYDIIPKQIPYYDEEDHAWYYNDESSKRGGLKLRYQFTMEKSYPENGYTFQGKVGDKNIYIKEQKDEISDKYDPNVSRDHTVEVPVSCLKRATDLGIVKKRANGILEIIVDNKKLNNYQMVYTLKTLMDACPVYADALTISGNGNVTGNIYFYYKFPRKVKQ